MRKRWWGLGGLCLMAALFGGFELWVRSAPIPPIKTELSDLVYTKDDDLLAAYTTEDGFWRFPISTDTLDPKYITYLTAYEDRRFERHNGVDLRALGRSFWEYLSHGRIVSGGSTLTMQTVRLMNDLPTRSLRAKLAQIRTALAMERRYSKKDILQLYLHNAPFGGNIEGINAASYAFFGKPPSRLTEGEAALLVAIPQSPNARRPDKNPKTARAARAHVIRRLTELDVIPPKIAAEAINEPLPSQLHPFPRRAMHLANQLRKTGLKATIDANLQDQIETMIRRKLANLPPRVSGSVLVVDRHSLEVRAYLGALEYQNHQRQGYVDMVRAVRSPGSTLKPLIFGMGFSDGFLHPDTLINDAPVQFDDYRPSNFDGQFMGYMTARDALRTSRNIPTLKVLHRLGVAQLMIRLERAGVIPRHNTTQTLGLAVGVGGIGVTPLEMAGLYATLFNDGLYRPLRLVSTDADSDPRPIRVLQANAAADVVSVLKNPVAPGGRRAQAIAYKTGTSYGYRDAWTIGGDAQHIVLVHIGRADNQAIPGLTGYGAAAPILFDIFDLIGVSDLYRTGSATETPRLPEHLRYFNAGMDLSASLVSIDYPPDGGIIEVCDNGIDADITGGAPPFVWLLDGTVINPKSFERRQVLDIAQNGYFTLSVVDAQNHTNRAQFQVDNRQCH